MPVESVTLTGHLIDTGQLARALDEIISRGADYEMVDIRVGKFHDDESNATLRVTAGSDDKLAEILAALVGLGATPVHATDAEWVVADRPGCFPPNFHSTTNMPTQVRIDGSWVDVALPEMDCGIVLTDEGPVTRAITEIEVGDRVLVGFGGTRIVQPRSSGPVAGDGFSFMSSEVSSEKPQGLLVQQVADGMRACRETGKKILWVAGPALVHTGSVPATVALIRAGYLDVLFAGNALPTHDIEASIYGTSLGVSQALGVPTEHGHSHHIRAINAVRREGSIAAAVEAGVITSGIMHAAVTNEVEWVLAGSVRDDGPLPDVVTDMGQAQSRMRAHVPDIGYCLVVCTMLHGIATGNLLPAQIPLVCVDINPATVTKLADRGSAQATGIVTDVGLFVKELAEELAPGELDEELEAAKLRGHEHAAAYASGVPH